MPRLIILLFLLCSFSLSPKDAEKLAERIWRNESSSTLIGLTCWNERENFASMGIGHFIWYPTSKKERYEETFPSLLRFFKEQKVILPTWLEKTQECPWDSRADFYQAIESNQMKELRELLIKTKSLQALFIANRLEKTVSQMLETLPQKQKETVSKVFRELSKDFKGLYALIDYLNFKGSGLISSESYEGKRWGLLQVLETISPSSENMLADFVLGAKKLLSQRVEYSPKERKEEKYLKGWFNRLDTYLE